MDDEKFRRKGLILAAIVSFLAIVLAIVMVIRLVEEDIHKKVPVPMNVNIPGFVDDESTRIPLEVKGDIDGIFFVNSKGEGLDLEDGLYSVYFPASPLCNNGVLYSYPKRYFDVIINDHEVRSLEPVNVSFTILEPSKISDDLINRSLGYAKQDSESSDKAETYANNTKAIRDKALGK